MVTPCFPYDMVPGKVLLELAHYYTHFDDLPALFLELAALILCTVWIIRAIRQRDWKYMVFIGLTIVSCVFFGYWINRIPFCTECDHISRSELGFMLEPFADRFGYLPD